VSFFFRIFKMHITDLTMATVLFCPRQCLHLQRKIVFSIESYRGAPWL